MFTENAQIQACIVNKGYAVDSIEYIDKGVMTDKYLVKSCGKRYIARCFPTDRSWLAKAEFLYLNYFYPKGIKVPRPVFYNESPAMLFYEEIDGTPLNEVFDILSDEEKDNLCREILDNYNKICKIETTGYGRMRGYEQWSHDTWLDFLNETIDNGYKILQGDNRSSACQYVEDMRDDTKCLLDPPKCLVWSDFCQENIIVTHDHHLAGFIDMEGLIAGDPTLGIGYLKSHDQSDFAERIYEAWNADLYHVDFYAVFRYLGLLPYRDMLLPNGSEREPINSFLKYSHNLLETKNINMTTISRHFKKNSTLYVTILQIVICVTAFYFIPGLYTGTIQNSDIFVENGAPGIELIDDSPSWFKFDSAAVHTCIAISDESKKTLLSLAAREDPLYQSYSRTIDELAFKSNNDTSNYFDLLLLTLCFISLGCIARSFFDFIGHRCYKGGQDMVRWWPWYVFRPLIGAPIATFLIVAVRTAMFSNVFVARDMCTYLAITFLAGFSMMEFLRMLRRVSKSIFGEVN